MLNGKLRYLFRRLRSMSLEEPFYRLGSWLGHAVEKRRYRLDPDFASERRILARRSEWLEGTAVEDPAGSLTAAVSSSPPGMFWNRASFWGTFADRYPAAADRLISMASLAAEGRFLLFGRAVVESDHGDPWSRTFEPGFPEARWPSEFHSDIRVSHDPDRPERDIKWCWEINRFQHLLWLGAAWRLTGDRRFVSAARSQIESWLDSVHYPEGVQWTSNLEVGLRALAWVRCHALCCNGESWTREFVERLVCSIYHHAIHLERELTVHHAVGNHLLGEASALFHLALQCPMMSDRERWKRKSAGIINRIVPRLILSDGVYAEQSTGYFRFVAELLLQAVQIAQYRADGALHEVIGERLLKGLEFIREISPDIREVPMIGDADSGVAIGWRLSSFRDFSSLSATASVLLGRPELSEDLSDFPPESFLTVGEEGLSFFASRGASGRARENDQREPTVHDFPAGGYQTARDDRFLLLFDSGPLGLSPGFGHGHADGLSFLLSYEGTPFVTDVGTGLYNGSREWREYFRSTAAHNTLTVDGRSQSEPLSTFSWAKEVLFCREAPLQGKDWVIVRGSVAWNGTSHCRFVVHVYDRGVIVADYVAGDGVRDLAWHVHFDPRWEVAGAGRAFRASWQEKALTIDFPGQQFDDLRVMRGNLDPMAGWYSQDYGSREPTRTLCGAMRTALPTQVLMVVSAGGEGVSLPRDLPLRVFPENLVPLLKSLEASSV